MAVCRSRSGLLTEPRESRPYGAHIETACGLEMACVLSTATPSGRCASPGWWPVRVTAHQLTSLRAPRHDAWSRRAGGAESAQPLRGMFRSSGSRPAGDVMRRSPIGLLFHVSDDGRGGRRDQGEHEGVCPPCVQKKTPAPDTRNGGLQGWQRDALTRAEGSPAAGRSPDVPRVACGSAGPRS